MAIQKFYFHDASSGVSGTLPSSEHSAQTAAVTASTAGTARTMDASHGVSQTSIQWSITGTTAQRAFVRMFCSAPLAAQRIVAGNWQMSIAGRESSLSSNLKLTSVIYAWRPSTGAVVGSLISDFVADTAEPGSANTEASLTDTTIAGTAVDILDGDILVCEIWRDATVQGTAGPFTNDFFYDGTTEASATNNAGFLLAPMNIFLLGENAPTNNLVTGYPQGAGAGSNNRTTIVLNPGSAIGDSLFIIVGINHNTITSTGASSANSGSWVKVANFSDSTNTWRIDVWMGKVTGTGTHTVTVSYSASVASVITEIDAYSFHSSRNSGAPNWWVATSSGQHNGNNAAPPLPTLVPSVDNVQTYLGFCSPQGAAQVGATIGYAYSVLDSTWVTGAYSIGVIGSQTPAVGQDASVASTVIGLIFTDKPIDGTGGCGLKKPALAGTATNTAGGGTDTGTGSVNLKKPSLSLAGKEKYSITGSAGLKKPSLSLAGKEKYSITGSAGLKKPALSLHGGPHIIGTGSVNLKKPSLSASAFEEEAGTGSVALKKPSLALSGPAEKISGTGSVGLKKPALSLSSSEKISGTGSISLKKPAIQATNIVSLRLYPTTDGPSTVNDSAGDTSSYVVGLSFEVTGDGYQLNGWWIWVADNQSTAAEDFALWAVGVAYVADSKVTSGTFTPGWNFVPCASPIPLTNGQEYRAVRSVNKAGDGDIHYASTHNYFDTGDGASGIVNGALTAYGNGDEPSLAGQMTFYFGSVDVTTAFPTAEFDASNYWLDVQVGSVSAIVGTVDVSLKKPALSLAGKPRYLITGSAGLKKPALSASGPAEKISGTGSCGLKKPVLSISAKEKISGTGNCGLKKPSLALSGKEKYILTGSCGLKKPSLSISAKETISGTGSVSLKKPLLFISSSNSVSGSGGVTLKKPSVSLAAKERFIATGGCGLKKPHVSAAGREIITGTGSCGLKKPQLTLSAKEREAATGSVSLKKPHISGTATVSFHSTGTGSVSLKKPRLDLEGFETISGSGSIHMKKMRIEAQEFSIPSNSLFIFTSV